MKKEKNKYGILIISIISLVILTALSILIYKKFEDNSSKPTDSERFKEEYKNVPDDNLFVYTSSEDIIKILENGTGVIYLGFPECKWCQAYVPILNEVAKNEGIEKIHYLNILEDRKNNTSDYQKIVEILGDNLLYDDEGNHRIYVPDVTIINKGEIVGHDNESSLVTEEDGTPETYWTTEKKEALKTRLKSYIDKIDKSICTSC